jgi:hypothetical protein
MNIVLRAPRRRASEYHGEVAMPKAAAKMDDAELLTLEGHDVRISSPTKPYFTKQVQLSKLDIVKYS